MQTATEVEDEEEKQRSSGGGVRMMEEEKWVGVSWGVGRMKQAIEEAFQLKPNKIRQKLIQSHVMHLLWEKNILRYFFAKISIYLHNLPFYTYTIINMNEQTKSSI